MTTGAPAGFYSPVPRSKDLERLVVFSPSSDIWAEVHENVQRHLDVLERDVRSAVAGVQASKGSSRGERFLLFSHRTFCAPGCEIDPVVVGVTFKRDGGAVAVEADVSGEQTGDLIQGPISQTVAENRGSLLKAATESVVELSRSAPAIIVALKDSSRRVR